MSNEDKLSTLEEVKECLESALRELNQNSNEFGRYIELIQSDLDEITPEIDKLEDEQNHIWKEEIKEANMEFERMRL